jgi:hypothetical protein
MWEYLKCALSRFRAHEFTAKSHADGQPDPTTEQSP